MTAPTPPTPARRRRGGSKEWLGSAMLAAVTAAVVTGPWWLAHPNAFHFAHALAPPSWRFPFGTNELGQNVFAQTLYAGRWSLAISGGAAGLAVAWGTVVGLIAGWLGGRWDGVAMRLVDMWLAFPPLLVATVWAGEVGSRPLQLAAVLALIGWMPAARLVRAHTLALKQAPFVVAAHLMGAPPTWIWRRHLLPNLLPVVTVAATLEMAYALLTESALSFLGLGVQPPAYDWGSLVGAQQTQLASAPWLALPGVMVAWTVLGVNWLGEGLNERWAPASRLGAPRW